MIWKKTRPFLVTVTGKVPIEPALIARMNQKNTLLMCECDPANPEGCVDKLQNYKKQFGDADNIVVSMKAGAADRVDAAKRTLYLALIKSGWTKESIYAVFGASASAGGGGGGRGGGGSNLSRLAPPARGRGN